MRIHRVIWTEISPMLKDAKTFGDLVSRTDKRVDIGVGWNHGSSSNEGGPFDLLVDHLMKGSLLTTHSLPVGVGPA